MTVMIKILSILYFSTFSHGFITPPSPHHTSIHASLSQQQQRSTKPSFLSPPHSSSSSSYTSSLLQMASTESETIPITDVITELQSHKESFGTAIAEAADTNTIEKIRVEYLGKKGHISKAMTYMRSLSAEDKPKLGAVVNEIKDEMESTIVERKKTMEAELMERQMEEERIDGSLPGLSPTPYVGKRHPLSMTMEKATEIFIKLGYDTVTDAENSPEIESDYYCFEALNCPFDHPARDMQDTFYLKEDMKTMLRTHTSSVQIRQMERRTPPFRIVSPGRVYRKDDIDATHSMVFHQVEILALDKRGELNLGHLKGTVEYFLKEMFGPNIKVRFRGSYFPFTEPSMEVDVFFKGRWLEVLGCGMVDPNVLEMAGIDPLEYSGFAAGFGVERFAMVIHGIDDIREFYKNDLRFLDQFPHFYDEGTQDFLSGGLDKEVEEELANIPDLPCFADEEDEELEAELAELAELAIPGYDVAALEKAIEEGTLEVEEEGGTTTAKVEKEKAPKEEKKKKTPPPATTDGDIDISKLDIRVGIIKKIWHHDDADKLFCEEIDIGEEEPRQIASGLREHYTLEDMEGRRVLVLANLKARKLMGFPSHGMVLCAVDDSGKVVFVEPPEGAEVGERVMVDGFDGEPATENQVIKKKMLDAIFPELKTDGSGTATYRGKALSTAAGPCVAQNGMANAQIS